jgi:hypothetical protein
MVGWSAACDRADTFLNRYLCFATSTTARAAILASTRLRICFLLSSLPFALHAADQFPLPAARKAALECSGLEIGGCDDDRRCSSS